jgi:hypothetical protein
MQYIMRGQATILSYQHLKENIPARNFTALRILNRCKKKLVKLKNNRRS